MKMLWLLLPVFVWAAPPVKHDTPRSTPEEGVVSGSRRPEQAKAHPQTSPLSAFCNGSCASGLEKVPTICWAKYAAPRAPSTLLGPGEGESVCEALTSLCRATRTEKGPLAFFCEQGESVILSREPR